MDENKKDLTPDEDYAAPPTPQGGERPAAVPETLAQPVAPAPSMQPSVPAEEVHTPPPPPVPPVSPAQPMQGPLVPPANPQTAFAPPAQTVQGGYPGYPPVYASPRPAQKKVDGLAVAALVFGICGIVFSFCCIGAPFGIAAVILGIVALAKKTPSGGMSVAGIIMGGVSILLSIVMILYAVLYAPSFLRSVETELDHLDDYYSDYFDDSSRSNGYDYYRY